MYYPAHLNSDFSVQTAHLIQSNSEQGGKLLRPPYQTSVLLSSYSQEQWRVVQFFEHSFLVAQEHKFMLQHLLPLIGRLLKPRCAHCTIAQRTLGDTYMHIVQNAHCTAHVAQPVFQVILQSTHSVLNIAWCTLAFITHHKLQVLNSAHFACTHGWLPVELILWFVFLFINIHLGKRHSICTHYMPGRAHCLLVLVQLIHTFELHASLITHRTMYTFVQCSAQHARPPPTGCYCSN